MTFDEHLNLKSFLYIPVVLNLYIQVVLLVALEQNCLSGRSLTTEEQYYRTFAIL
jgi:hypothetical protein